MRLLSLLLMLLILAVFFIFSLLVFVLLALKIYEMIRSLVWVQQHGLGYANALHSLVEKWRKTGFSKKDRDNFARVHKRTWKIDEWPIGGWFKSVKTPYNEWMVNTIFRLPTLLSVQVAIVFVSPSSVITFIGVFLIWLALWADVVHNLANSLTLGYMNGYFRRTVCSRRMSRDSSTYPDETELNVPRRQVVREFTVLFAFLLGMNIIGYAGIYFGLNSLGLPSTAFEGVSEDWTRSLDFLYFSVVTLATVGYGDVRPQDGATLVRLAVVSQILSGVSLTVFLLTSFSLTIDPE